MTEPFAYTVRAALAVSGGGRTALYEAIKEGGLRAVKRGRRTLILAEDLRSWLHSLPAIEPKSQSREATRFVGALGPSKHQRQGRACAVGTSEKKALSRGGGSRICNPRERGP